MTITTSEEAGVRYLHFGSTWVQGAMRIARPFALELDYTREMLLPLLLRGDDWPRRVLLIGLGAGSLTKFLWRHRPQAMLTVVEIDPQVTAVARQSFKLPDDPERIRIHHADGVDFVIGDRQRYDLILVDGFDAKARAGPLDSLPFYLNCKARLAENGLLSVNLLARRNKFTHSLDRLREAFDNDVLAFASRDAGNAIAIAGVGAVPSAPTFDIGLTDAAQRLKAATQLNLLPAVTNLRQTALTPFSSENATKR